jgi:hypothetical protein
VNKQMLYDRGSIKALKPQPVGGRMRENMPVAEEKTLLARFATAEGAGEMLSICDSSGLMTHQQQHGLRSARPARLAQVDAASVCPQQQDRAERKKAFHVR